MESEEIIKTKPKLLPIGLFAIGTLFFGYFAYVILSSEIKVADDTSEKVTLFIKWIFFGIFFSFSIGSLYNIIGFKIYYLTKKDLIICQPLLFQKKVLPLQTVDKIFEKDNQISISRGLSYVPFYIGKVTIVEFIYSKKIKFDSLTIKNYSEFKKTISKLI
jgi:hypothetical protein